MVSGLLRAPTPDQATDPVSVEWSFLNFVSDGENLNVRLFGRGWSQYRGATDSSTANVVAKGSRVWDRVRACQGFRYRKIFLNPQPVALPAVRRAMRLPGDSVEEAIEDAEIDLDGWTVRGWLTAEEGRALH